jgi:hypothetical protein
MVAGFFTSTPINSALSACNDIVTTVYSDESMTTLETTGNAVITESLNYATWD